MWELTLKHFFSISFPFSFLFLILNFVLISAEILSNITDEELAKKIREINSQNGALSMQPSRLSLARASSFLKNKANVFRETWV